MTIKLEHASGCPSIIEICGRGKHNSGTLCRASSTRNRTHRLGVELTVKVDTGHREVTETTVRRIIRESRISK